MLKLLQVAAGRAPFSEWVQYAEAMAPRKKEKLDALLNILYVLLEDMLLLSRGCRRNPQCRYPPRSGGAGIARVVPLDPRGGESSR